METMKDRLRVMLGVERLSRLAGILEELARRTSVRPLATGAEFHRKSQRLPTKCNRSHDPHTNIVTSVAS